LPTDVLNKQTSFDESTDELCSLTTAILPSIGVFNTGLIPRRPEPTSPESKREVGLGMAALKMTRSLGRSALPNAKSPSSRGSTMSQTTVGHHQGSRSLA
jgi:hypothetical protein